MLTSCTIVSPECLYYMRILAHAHFVPPYGLRHVLPYLSNLGAFLSQKCPTANQDKPVEPDILPEVN